MFWLPLAALAVLVTPATHAASDTRAAFLKLLDRPRVPLVAETAAPGARDGLVEIAFSFAAEEAHRVPGLLVKPANGSGRRPAVIVLHGTGGNKESQRILLAEFARHGFAAIAIDGRYHGARTKGGAKVRSAEYVDAMLPLIAPRPLLAINGEIDPRTPIPGLQLCADAATAAYRAAGAGDRFVLHIQPKTAHRVLPESLVLAREWFVRWLVP
jgi:poly(3-hydroxybutyrate) depolymerase